MVSFSFSNFLTTEGREIHDSFCGFQGKGSFGVGREATESSEEEEEK
jgi:hypothetical protein